MEYSGLVYPDPSLGEVCPKPALVVDQSQYAVPPTGQLVVADPSPNPGAAVPIESVTSRQSTFTEWRLLQELRASAAVIGRHFDQPFTISPPPADWDERDPIAVLRNAATVFARDPVEGLAMADLAVTGRICYEALAAMSFQAPADVVTRLVSLGEDQAAATRVVERAQQVAWAIRGNPSWRATLRPQLGWIGVSGEDDAPHRPCNVFSLPGPQFDVEVPDIPVTSGTLTVKTRIVIAEDPWPPPTTAMPGTPPTFLPPDDTPTVSFGSDYVFLFMAGDCSRAEEARDMIPALLAAAQAQGKRASVIAFDMIGWGYSGRKVFDGAGRPILFDQAATFADGQPLFPLVRYPANPPALQFTEDFVVALMRALSQQAPNIDLAKVIPIGGSLGGNLALRLGRRTDLDWLTAVCGWSPASVWSSFTGSALGRDAIGHCTDRMNALEDGPDDINASPAGSRHTHFSEVFDQDTVTFVVQIVPAQADMWYRGYDWNLCKLLSICCDRLDRREIYDPTFRRWHWRISQDQLVYSHRDPDPATGVPRYLLNTIPMLLAAGANDDYPMVSICSNTRELAQKMTVCQGVSLFLNDTGHSIHNERPKELSRAIVDFLGQILQNEWWWCSRCSGLFWSGEQRSVGGICPTGGTHGPDLSFEYRLTVNVSSAPGQHDWLWCKKCSGLFWSPEAETAGVCPAGGAHGPRSGSGNYALINDAPAFPGQHGWRYCGKCTGLFWNTAGSTGGACPAGGTHVQTGTTDYALVN